MPADSAPNPRDRDARRRAGTLLVIAFAAFAVACGITMSSGEAETELFKGLSLDGDLRAGGDLVLRLTYEQPYDTDVQLLCDVLADEPPTPEITPTPSDTPPPDTTPTSVPVPFLDPPPPERVATVLADSLPRNPDGGPVAEATPLDGTITRTFVAPQTPGGYMLSCYTPQDENNSIAVRFFISPLPTATPEPPAADG